MKKYNPLLKIVYSLSLAIFLLLIAAGCYNPLMEKIMNHPGGSTPDVDVYSISLSGYIDFGNVLLGYPAQPEYAETVTNTGNKPTGELTITLSGRDSDSFILSDDNLPDIDPGEEDHFTVVPKLGLGVGLYIAVITVSGGNGISESFDVSFGVGVEAITDAVITGVTLPSAGEDAEYTAAGAGVINYTIADQSWAPPDVIFRSGTVYTAVITLEANTGYTFSGFGAATINGYDAVISDNNAASVTLSCEFPKTNDAIESVSITIPSPQKKVAIDSIIVSGSGNFTIGEAVWSPDGDSEFKAGTKYTATLTLTAIAGYVFSESADAAINGGNADISDNTLKTITISHTFPSIPAISGGSGTAGDPFIIDDEDALYAIRDDLNGYYSLENDITLTEGWAPIGDTLDDDSRQFTGTFDGNGNSIEDLTVNSAGDYHGMFGAIGPGGKVKNLTMVNSIISGASYVGGVAGLSKGTVENCCMVGTIVSSSLNETGGIVGRNYGIVQNCYTTGSVSSSNNQVGGIVGNNDSQGQNYFGQVINCYSTCAVHGPSGNNKPIGGIAGENKGNNVNVKILNCVALNDEITGGVGNAIGRVVGAKSGNNNVLDNNYGKIGMQKKDENGGNVSLAWGNSATGIDGADVTEGTNLDQYNNQAFWESLGWDFSGSPGIPPVWFWDSVANLPKLTADF